MRLFVEINIRGTTVLVATHDLELIRRMGKRDADARARPPATTGPRRARAPPIVREAPFLPLSLSGQARWLKPRYVFGEAWSIARSEPAPDRWPRSR